MDRDNFYLLLNLNLDPPESDPKKIETAINRMRATWSRYRNHPSKGIQAKKYIGMISDIRKVMGDPHLRHKEAEEAKKILNNRKREKFAQVDRHLKLRQSKGFITDQEITKLAGMHKLKEEAIRERIKELEAEKISAVDEDIRLRLAKGYVTEGDITSIAKRHGLRPREVRIRIKAPIRKDEDVAADEVQRLDRSIAQNISDNLKIVGKQDLYDFLDATPTANNQQLVSKAKQKETEIQNSGKKDANITASGALVGLCMSVFKSEESRRGYDILLARSRLSEFDADIDVAGMDGQIREEYFDILVNRGIEFGMDRDESADYIADYCKKKGWAIVKPRPEAAPASPKKKYMSLVVILILLIGVGGAYLWRQKVTQTEREFRQLIQRASQVSDLNERIRIYQSYLNSNTTNEYSNQISQKLNATRDEIQKRTYNAVVQKASQAEATSLDAALDVYLSYLKDELQNPYTQKATQKRDFLISQIDDRDYRQTLIPTETQTRMVAYRNYLDSHPQGKYIKEIKKRLIDMSQEYYFFTKKNIKAEQGKEAWDKCLEWVQGYLDVYGENRHTKEMKDLRDRFSTLEQDKRIFQSLQVESRTRSANLEDARQVYKNYLSAYPDTTIRDKVEVEIDRLTERMNQARIDNERQKIRNLLKSSTERFMEEVENVISDGESGLMWTLLDSKQFSTHCLNYTDAKSYIRNLTTGNYTDWRLPTLEEIDNLYSGGINLPGNPGEWFWTAEKYTRYADGWITEVRTLERRLDSQWSESKHDARNCGHVRAVRP